MLLYKAVIHGQPVTKKNHGRIITNRKTGKPMLIPSPQYTAYEERAGYQIRRPKKPISEPVTVKCLYYMQTARRVDLVNLIEATHDILVKFGVLADDNSKIIISVDGSRVYVDRDKPRAEIFIEEAVDNGKAYSEL